jgi:hypothetical protein
MDSTLLVSLFRRGSRRLIRFNRLPRPHTPKQSTVAEPQIKAGISSNFLCQIKQRIVLCGREKRIIHLIKVNSKDVSLGNEGISLAYIP